MDSSIERNSERLRDLITKILSSGIGGQFTIGGAIHVLPRYGGGYIVGGVDERFPDQLGNWQIEFEDIEEAVDQAIIRRTDGKIGIDF
jgi:hypothetical protein